MQQKLYWNDKNRIPQSDPTDLIDRAMTQYTWYFWLLTFIGVAWMLSLIVSHTLIVGLLPIPGQQLKRLIK